MEEGATSRGDCGTAAARPQYRSSEEADSPPRERGNGRARAAGQRAPQQGVPERAPHPGVPERAPHPGVPERAPQQGVPERAPQQGVPERPPHPGVPERPPHPGVPERAPHPGVPERAPHPGVPERLPHPTLPGVPERPPHPTLPDVAESPPHPCVTERPPHPDLAEKPSYPVVAERPPHPGVTERPPHSLLPGVAESPPHPGVAERLPQHGVTKGPPHTLLLGVTERLPHPGVTKRPPLLGVAERVPLIAAVVRDVPPPESPYGDGHCVGRPPAERRSRRRRENALESCREESACGGYEKAWHALSGYDSTASPVYEGAPISGYERMSVERAHTMKDFEKQITELKKENFNLKLRIYFLEEQIQRRCDTSNDELHRMNIELKVEVESLKHDYQEKHKLLVRASKAMESLASEHDLAIQRLQEEHLKHLQDMEDAHSHKLQLLDAEIAHEKEELEKMCLLIDQERMQSFNAEERLLALNEKCTKNMGVLEERDWIIQCLNETVHSKDALIAQLEKQIASMMPYEACGDQNSRNLYLVNDAKDLLQPIRHVDVTDGEEKVNEWQKKIKEMDNLINELQQKLEANKAGSVAEEKNALKRDKAIQGLTLALKKKTKEHDKFSNKIDSLHAALSKAREAAQQAQLQNLKENVHPDYRRVVFTLQAEQDMHSRLLKYERESGSLQKELESIAVLRRWLEKNIQANQELRKMMEAQLLDKYKGEDSMSFVGDQTSYFSICLDHLDPNEYFFAGGPQGAAVSKTITHFGESHQLFKSLGEDAGTQTQSHVLVSAGGSPKHDQYYESDPSLQERSKGMREDGENCAQPTRNKQKTVSSATQTETRDFSDRCIPDDVPCLPKEAAELMWCLQEGDLISKQRLPQKTNNNTYKMQGCKRDVINVRQNAKKSRLPILLKSSLNTKLKTDAALTLAKGNEEGCPEKESQIQNGRPSEQSRCAEMEVASFTEDRDLIPEIRNTAEQRDPTEQGVHQELGNHRLSEELDCAEGEITTLKANEETLRCKEYDFYHSMQRASSEQALKKELQAENDRDSEQLQQAQMEVRALQANEDLIKHEGIVPESSGSIKKQREFSDQELQTGYNHWLSEQLKQAQIEIVRLKTYEDLVKHNDSLSNVTTSNKVQMESTEKTLQLQAERLERAQMEIKTLKASEGLLRSKAVDYALHNSEDEQRQSTEQVLQKGLQGENCRLSEQLKQAEMEIQTHKYSVPDLSSFKDQNTSEDQTLQKELQEENFRLSEELKTAQIEIQALKANAALMKHKDTSLDISSSIVVESTDRVLQEELKAENDKLSEELKEAKMEIEKLQAERSPADSSDNSLKLHGSDADDDLSEQSCLDKTITNTVRVNEVDATSDFGDELCRPNVNSRNAVALRCHHDRHCTECANNRGIISLPTSNSKRASTMRSSSKFTTVSCSRRSHEDTTSLSKYDLLVQSQARELSLQRQKIKESHNLSVICSKNFYNILKTFENLFPAGALDSNITLGFQEQVTQTVEWLKELEYKLSDALYGEEDAYSDHSADSLLYTPSRLVPGHKMWADKHGCHVLGLVEDYNALRKQLMEARNVLQEMEDFIDHGVQTAVLNMTEHFGNVFFENLVRTKQSLEEAGCLLKLLWRVSLPLQIHSSYNNNQEEDENLEITRLRKRVLEQEKVLSGMVKRVYSESQMKEDIEKLILDQLAMTHDILKRAKGNLEVQVVDQRH